MAQLAPNTPQLLHITDQPAALARVISLLGCILSLALSALAARGRIGPSSLCSVGCGCAVSTALRIFAGRRFVYFDPEVASVNAEHAGPGTRQPRLPGATHHYLTEGTKNARDSFLTLLSKLDIPTFRKKKRLAAFLYSFWSDFRVL